MSELDINSVDYLLKNRFLLLSDKLKQEILLKGRAIPKQTNLVQIDGKRTRKFNREWFAKIPWLTYSEERSSLFCFPCLLFCDQVCTWWCCKGFKDLKHLSEKIKFHNKDYKHIKNIISLNGFSTSDKSQIKCSSESTESIEKHNEKGDINNSILHRLIDAILYLLKQEQGLQGHAESLSPSLNRGNYRELLNVISKYDPLLDSHLKEATFEGTSSHIQNDIITCIGEVLDDHINNELNETKYVSIQVDDYSDVINKEEYTVILRYIVNCKPVERFIGFRRVLNCKAEGLCQIMLDVLNERNLLNKLISYTYDGATLVAGEHNSLQKKILEICPNAHFVHSYAHQLNLIIQESCLYISKVKVFFSAVSTFHTFFTSSPTRSEILERIRTIKNNCCEKELKQSSTRESQLKAIIINNSVKNIYDNFEALEEVFSEILESSEMYDVSTLLSARFHLHDLQDFDFVFLLEVFNKIFSHSTILNTHLQKQKRDGTFSLTRINKFIQMLTEVRSDEFFNELIENTIDRVGREPQPPKRSRITATNSEPCNRPNARKAMYFEIIDAISLTIKNRFQNVHHLECFDIIRHSNFPFYKNYFPNELLMELSKFYSEIFDVDQLKTQLSVIYSDKKFHKSPMELILHIKSLNLVEELNEIVMLLELFLTIPITSVTAGRAYSTMRRIKSCKRSTLSLERSSTCALISIEKELLHQLEHHDKVLHNRTIEKFLHMKEEQNLLRNTRKE